ncbi:HVO_2753 family zinc finger protein [Halobaculum sp. MBLA0147]|uniref:HVO_2753 family zinc finger protein n=1 Tax=Halobaculum sp. MBLA0147 TaxID=3079934 RepID=UPI00352525A8
MSDAEQAERAERRCVSCGINVAGLSAASFDCPECGTGIDRCATCRKQSKLYECPSCGFRGP